ncbi:MAG: hypothetical protein IKY65_04620 [Rikenellaceae bacterium]|nr:hypothetical protein [Rikenellaceae bacterium]
MKNYHVTLEYFYTFIKCDIEAISEDEALGIFWEEVALNEGDSFAARAMEHGSVSVEARD